MWIVIVNMCLKTCFYEGYAKLSKIIEYLVIRDILYIYSDMKRPNLLLFKLILGFAKNHFFSKFDKNKN